MRIRPATLSISLCVALAFAAGPAGADGSESAAQLRNDGVALYQAKQYRAAAIKFAAAHKLSPDPDTLFAWAQAERLDGSCARAIPLYEKFLDATPSARQRDAANTLLEICRAELAAVRRAEKHEAAERGGSEEARDRPAVTASSAGERRGWSSDWVGHSFTASGAIGLGLGAGFLVSAYSSRDRAGDAGRYDEYGARLDDARTYRTIGVVAGSVGVVLIGAGIWHYISYSGEPVTEPGGLAAWATADSAGASWSARF